MKFLTLLGNLIVLSLSVLASIFSFIFIASDNSRITFLSMHDDLIFVLFSTIMSLTVGLAVAAIIIFAIVLSSKLQTLEFRTIYSNDRDIEVYVRTNLGENIFAGEYLHDKIVSTFGTLKLKKHGASISQSIDKIEYVGLNQKGSKVEKIEYSETIFGESLFGLQLLNDVKSTSLKIYLTDPRSKDVLYAEEELRDFLYRK